MPTPSESDIIKITHHGANSVLVLIEETFCFKDDICSEERIFLFPPIDEINLSKVLEMMIISFLISK